MVTATEAETRVTVTIRGWQFRWSGDPNTTVKVYPPQEGDEADYEWTHQLDAPLYSGPLLGEWERIIDPAALERRCAEWLTDYEAEDGA